MTAAFHEVYALRYGTHPTRRAVENFMGHDPQDDAVMPLDFYMWVIKGRDRTTVVDTGFDAETARRRRRVLLRHPVDMLRDVGVEAAEVTDVVLTHMHYDHCGNLAAFPGARFHVQAAEMAYATGRCMSHGVLRKTFDVENVVAAVRCLFDGRMVLHDGDCELFDGLSLHRVGGHTRGLQVVRVPTRRGHVVLASDAAHYWQNIRGRSPFPIVVDVEAMLEGYGSVEALSDGPHHVIPGHDPEVLRVFPTLPRNGDIAILHEDPAG